MRLAPLVPVVILAAAPAGAATAQTVPAGAPQAAPELAPVLERAGRYALEYEEKLQGIAAEEEYTQWVRMADARARAGRAATGLRPGTTARTVEGPVPAADAAGPVCFGSSSNGRFGPSWCRRTTKADLVFVRLAAGLPWSCFRDVYEVDGNPVRAHELRLERVFATAPSANAEQQARGLQAANDALYNIGPALRDLDAPTLALLFLQPKNQALFAWKARGKGRSGSGEAVEIAFEELARPTVIRQATGEDLPARGRLWIDPAAGALVHSETEFRFEPKRARVIVATEYREEPRFAMWVPRQTREEYENLSDAAPPVFAMPTKSTARYSRFRRFSASTAEAAPEPELSPPVSTYGAELLEVLRRAGEYAAAYERSFSDLLVEETYQQEVAPRMRLDKSGELVLANACKDCNRTTRSDLVFVRLAGDFPWGSYRDVFEVDGRKVREHEQRLVKLLSTPSPDALERARQLLAASATYNIGPVTRTVNLPTLPLAFLLPRNQARFEFRLGEHRTIASTEAVELAFRETSLPTLVKGPHDLDLPAAGRFWVNATRGTVVRNELELDFGPEAEARVTTDYRPEPSLAMWVPAEMREHFADVQGAKVQTFPNTFEGVARYGRFRRFTVQTEEQATVPQP